MEENTDIKETEAENNAIPSTVDLTTGYTPRKKVYRCVKCSQIFAKESTRRLHEHAQHGLPLPHCEICDKTFASFWYLRNHQILHTDKAIICDICGMKSSDQKAHNDHMVCHSDEKNFHCPHCPWKFKRRSELRHHKTLHTKRERDFKCGICDKGFYTKGTLSDHMKTHTGQVKKAECPVCGIRVVNLKLHMYSHLEASYKCEICDKVFTRPTALDFHMGTHFGREKVECHICKATINKIHLKNHIKIVHGDEKKHECEICGKQFSRSDYLLRHKTVHMDVKPFPCTQCERTFSRAQYLESHLAKVHKLSEEAINLLVPKKR